jgi:tryptophan synthase alpha chain
VTISEVFKHCAAEGRAALIPYLMVGDPSLELTPALLEACVAGGADIIELGIPYSDPLADGPTIQAAAQRALRGGTTFDAVLGMVASLDRTRIGVPLIAFTYYNPVYVRGVERSATDLVRAGFSGVIIPDLPPGEASKAQLEFERVGLSLTFLVAPTTPIERVRAIAAQSGDFVYVVSRMGVTGAGGTLSDDVRALVSRLRPVVGKPLAVGFGVSTPAHAHAIAEYADGVIVGSALVDAIAAATGNETAAVRDFCAALAAAVHR